MILMMIRSYNDDTLLCGMWVCVCLCSLQAATWTLTSLSRFAGFATCQSSPIRCLRSPSSSFRWDRLSRLLLYIMSPSF